MFLQALRLYLLQSLLLKRDTSSSTKRMMVAAMKPIPQLLPMEIALVLLSDLVQPEDKIGLELL